MRPLFGPRQAQTLDDLLAAGGEGWDFFKAEIAPPHRPDPFQPADRVATFLAAMVETADGRAVIEWLMDITLRLPLRVTGASLEETALRAATRQGINGVGEAVLAAIAHGQARLGADRRTATNEE